MKPLSEIVTEPSPFSNIVPDTTGSPSIVVTVTSPGIEDPVKSMSISTGPAGPSTSMTVAFIYVSQSNDGGLSKSTRSSPS